MKNEHKKDEAHVGRRNGQFGADDMCTVYLDKCVSPTVNGLSRSFPNSKTKHDSSFLESKTETRNNKTWMALKPESAGNVY